MPAPIKTGLVGASYTTQSVRADSSRCINWYPERIESDRGVSAMALYPTPGLSVFSAVGTGPMRGSEFINGRLLVVSGHYLYEIDMFGNIVATLGNVGSDNLQVSMASNTYQTLIISNGKGYILSGSVLSQIASADFPGNLPGVRALKCGYVDGYFFLLADNNKFYISALNDGTSWNVIDSSQIETSANKLVSMIIDHLEVFVFGSRIAQALYNSGDPVFPFQRIPSGVIEQGVSASDSISKSDNSFLFLVEDDRGGGTVCRISGYSAQRVSDHGIEYQLQRKVHQGIDLSQSVSWSYQADGHSFYCLYTPGTDTTKVYDSATKLWHERAYWNTTTGSYEPHRGINHVYAFGKHIIGDHTLGLLYDMDIETYTDNERLIRRLRQHPHIQAGGQRVTHKSLNIIMQTGVGLDVADGEPGYDPQLVLQYSDDGGETIASEQQTSIGKIGEYQKKVEYRGLGSTEIDRVYRLIATDPVPYRLFESYLEV